MKQEDVTHHWQDVASATSLEVESNIWGMLKYVHVCEILSAEEDCTQEVKGQQSWVI